MHLTLVRWLMAATLLLSARSASAQFSVDDLEMHVRLGRDSLTQVIAVKSDSDSLQQLRIELRDWSRDSLGRNVFHEYGALASTCGERLTVFPRVLQLAPRATEYVRVLYRPLPGDDPGCWGLVQIEGVRPPSQVAREEGAFVSFTLLTGVKVYVHRAQEVADGAVDFADVLESWRRARGAGGRADSTLVREVVTRFVNTGTAHLRVAASVEIRNERTELLHTLRGPEAYITPGAFRDVVVDLPTLAPGRYLAIVLLDYGGADITAAQVEFEIP